ncbi:MAG TPA: YegP family protein [Solirubrobacteraceae bacterium]|jgi:hypothetical protein
MKFQIRNASGGQFYWRIVAGNGQVLATSETYVSKAGCQNAIATVKSDARTAPTEDLT